MLELVKILTSILNMHDKVITIKETQSMTFIIMYVDVNYTIIIDYT